MSEEAGGGGRSILVHCRSLADRGRGRWVGWGEINRPHLEHICPKALMFWVSNDMVQNSSYDLGYLSRATKQDI